MNTPKSLILAVTTALSLVMGTAMAQEADSTYEEAPGYWTPGSIAGRQAQAARALLLNSSDADSLRSAHAESFPTGTTVQRHD